MTVDELIERRADEALAELRRMADDYLLGIGFSRAFLNRSRGQRLRFERQRKERNTQWPFAS